MRMSLRWNMAILPMINSHRKRPKNTDSTKSDFLIFKKIKFVFLGGYGPGWAASKQKQVRQILSWQAQPCL